MIGGRRGWDGVRSWKEVASVSGTAKPRMAIRCVTRNASATAASASTVH